MAVSDSFMSNEPSLYHWIDGRGTPKAEQASITVTPSVRGSVTFGWTTITGTTAKFQKHGCKSEVEC